jgi:hypothetical protein
MRSYTVYFILAVLIFSSCNSGKTDSIQNINPGDTIPVVSEKTVYTNSRAGLQLSIPDTIKAAKSYFFSNPDSADIFLLIIEPGLVRESKAVFQIVTADHRVIHTQSFDAFYFIRGIYEPDTIPAGGQEVYDEYMEKYWKSLTLPQFQAYFRKKVAGFFEEAIYSIDKGEFVNFKAVEEEIDDKDFLQEVLADSTINLIDIACFNCDEGGITLGYSKKKSKVVTLLEHD